MKIVSSILPPQELQEEAILDFPLGDFLFIDGFGDAGESFMMLSIYYIRVRINKTEKLKWIMVMSAGIDEMIFQNMQWE